MSDARITESPRGPIVVVGGANVDITGTPDTVLIAADSNPGHVRLSPGGVARNIAENLARLGTDVRLITALGDDTFGRYLAEECAHDRIDVSDSLVLAEEPGSLYLAILDERGDMALALNDMHAMERITPAVLAERSSALTAASLVVAEANLPADSLAWLADNVTAPIVLDAISVAKAPRARAILGRLAALHCNALEAAALLGDEVRTREDAVAAARALVELGVGRAYVTLGERGAVAADASGTLVELPAPPASLVNATGAGDAFTAGVAFAELAGAPLGDATQFALAVAAIAMASARTVSEAVSVSAVNQLLEEIQR